MVDALVGPRYKSKVAKDTPIKTRAEAAKLGQELLRVGYIHRSQRIETGRKRAELELVNGAFEEDALYTWVYEGKRTHQSIPLPRTHSSAALELCMTVTTRCLIALILVFRAVDLECVQGRRPNCTSCAV